MTAGSCFANINLVPGLIESAPSPASAPANAARYTGGLFGEYALLCYHARL